MIERSERNWNDWDRAIDPKIIARERKARHSETEREKKRERH